MSISIGDALLKIGVDKKDFDTDMKSIGETIKNHQKAIGLGMVAMGTAIVGGLAVALKAAAEEEAGIEKLRVAMQNVGISYDDNRESLEKLINTQQQKTAVADSDQRAALSTLITMTGNLTKSQDLLSLAMDISAGTGRDLSSVTSTLGYALAGNWGMVNRMIPALAEVESEEEKWMFLREKFAGQAEAYGQTMSGQMQLLKNNIGDVGEAIGGVLIPIVKSLFDKIMPVIESIKEWTAAHPGLTKVIVIATGAVGGLSLALGTALLLLPKIKAGFLALKLMLMSTISQIAIATAGIGVLIGLLAWFTTSQLKAQTYQREYNALQVETARYNHQVAISQGEVNEKVVEAAMDWITAAEAQEELTDRGEETLTNMKAMVEEWETGEKAIGKVTKATKSFAESLKGLNQNIQALLKLWPEAVGGFTEEQWAKISKYMPGYGKVPSVPSFQYGGIIREPTLLSSLQTLRPYAVAGEAGPERVSPMGGGVGVTITGNTFNVRSDSDIERIGQALVDKIKLKTGAKI